MKKRITLVLSILTVAAFLVSATIRRSSSGAPASHTGAPGEQTCATVGCHDDNVINSGTAKLSLELEGKDDGYIPGHTYPVKIKITDSEVTRFGFQIVALENKSLKDAGSFKLMDSVRTQLIRNRRNFTDRNYLTYTFEGTDAVNTGYGEWTVQWTAPADAKKGVTFYLAAVSGNDDMHDKGDKVYTSSYSFKQSKHKQ